MNCRRFVYLIILAAAFAASPLHAQQPPGTGLNYETRLTTMEDEMRALNGRIEQVEFATKRLEQALQRQQSDMDARLTRIETIAAQTPPAPPPAPAQAPAAANTPDANGTLGALKMQDGKVTGGVNNPKATPLPDKPDDYGLTPQEQYERAFDILRKADYVEAEKAFKSFIDKNPKDKLVENAKYWYGETLYVQNKYNESMTVFAEAYQQYPKGAKAPDCLLKLALSLSGLGKTKDACTTLTAFKNQYPNASANTRSRADEESAKLKCGGH